MESVSRYVKVVLIILWILFYITVGICCGAPRGRSGSGGGTSSGQNFVNGGGVFTGTNSNLAPSNFNLLLPANSTYSSTSAITLTWDNPSGETGFTVQIVPESVFIAASNTFNNPLYVYDINSANVTSHVVPSGVLTVDNVYYWRVIARNSAGEAVASNSPMTFRYFKPVSFNLLAPLDGSVANMRFANLTWETSVNAVSYELTVTDDQGVILQNFPRSLNTTSSPVGNLSFGTYHWKVKAINELGYTESVEFSFTYEQPVGNNNGQNEIDP
ncbi:MAG: hypothetical protein HY606_01110 [Planctomycetes bacterium]|nr:hypothetical protein [Planctomycetota bacterium]